MPFPLKPAREYWGAHYYERKGTPNGSRSLGEVAVMAAALIALLLEQGRSTARPGMPDPTRHTVLNLAHGSKVCVQSQTWLANLELVCRVRHTKQPQCWLARLSPGELCSPGAGGLAWALLCCTAPSSGVWRPASTHGTSPRELRPLVLTHTAPKYWNAGFTSYPIFKGKCSRKIVTSDTHLDLSTYSLLFLYERACL